MFLQPQSVEQDLNHTVEENQSDEQPAMASLVSPHDRNEDAQPQSSGVMPSTVRQMVAASTEDAQPLLSGVMPSTVINCSRILSAEDAQITPSTANLPRAPSEDAQPSSDGIMPSIDNQPRAASPENTRQSTGNNSRAANATIRQKNTRASGSNVRRGNRGGRPERNRSITLPTDPSKNNNSISADPSEGEQVTPQPLSSSNLRNGRRRTTALQGQIVPSNDSQSQRNEGVAVGPKLTLQQKEWLKKLEEIGEDDDEGWDEVLNSLMEAAKRCSPPSTSTRREERPNQTSNPRQEPRTFVPQAARRDRAPPEWSAANASRQQKSYHRDPAKTIREILSEPPTYCKSTEEEIFNHLSSMFSGEEHQWTEPPEDVPDFSIPSSEVEREVLLRRVDPVEAASRLARMGNTAPGPDGVKYSGLKKSDPGAHVLARIFSRCLQRAKTPESWKESTTILIHKAGDRVNLSNWRPLSLSNTVAKLYAGILVDRISSWAEDGRISAVQKGFTRHDGCLEHNFVLQAAMVDARRNSRSICIAWLDLANAFGSLPHGHMFGTLERIGMPAEMLSVIRDLYAGSTTRGKHSAGLTNSIEIKSGVKQGCPLSPIIFNLSLEPLLRAIE